VHISLVGMSNIGKTHWSNRLVGEAGFEHIDCDVLVEKKLDSELVTLGYRGLSDVAKWMGQPYDSQYAYTSQKYLACEREVMLEVLEMLRRPSKKPYVVDTTGSVIYTGDDILEELKKLTRIVHFEATPAHVTKLFERYIANPKPVIWGSSYAKPEPESQASAGQQLNAELLARRAQRYRRYITNMPIIWEGSFTPQTGEAPEETLKRCYPDLLAYRTKRYKAMAHVNIPYDDHRAPDATWEKLTFGMEKLAEKQKLV
jgi:hypothetical protein